MNKHTDKNDRRRLMTLVDYAAKKKGFKITGSALQRINDLVTAENDENPTVFNSIDGFATSLINEGHMDRSVSRATTGPTTLGARPAFKGETAKYSAGPGNDRRHVISSSSLGKAIENALAPAVADASLIMPYTEQVCSFLGKYGVEKDPRRDSLREVARAAWILAHNHMGNLWSGPSEPNRVRGFIRAPLRDRRIELAKLSGTTISITDAIGYLHTPEGPGMNGQVARQHWESMVHEVTATLRQNVVDLGGNVSVDRVVETLRNFEANADLDLPHEDEGEYANDGDYLSRIIEIYTQLTEPTIGIFMEGGVLDEFMRLDRWDPDVAVEDDGTAPDIDTGPAQSQMEQSFRGDGMAAGGLSPLLNLSNISSFDGNTGNYFDQGGTPGSMSWNQNLGNLQISAQPTSQTGFMAGGFGIGNFGPPNEIGMTDNIQGTDFFYKNSTMEEESPRNASQ